MAKKKVDDIWKVKRPAIAVDVILFSIWEGDLAVGIIKRKEEPYYNTHALPGRFVRYEEPIKETARQALRVKADVDPSIVYLEQLFTFGSDLHRDTRIRTISIVYYGLVDSTKIDFNEDKSNFHWHSVYNLPDLAFDHKDIIDLAVTRMRNKLWYSDIAFQLMPKEFTLSELQTAYEAILGEDIDKRNFRKKIRELDILKDLKKKKRDGAHRPAALYGFKRNNS